MSGRDFYALVSGPVPSPFDGDSYSSGTVNLTVTDLGVVRVPSGRLEACDPFFTLGDGPVFAVNPGDYPVRVTVADVSPTQDGSHLREAYLSVVFGDGEVASVEHARTVDGKEPGVGVDAGTVGVVDHDAVATAMPSPSTDWDVDVFDTGEPSSWFNLVDSSDHYREGSANVVMPLATNGENVVLSHSGWGDGCYPVMLTRDADGAPLGLHIDLYVVGDLDDEADIV